MPAIDPEYATILRREAAERIIARAPEWWQRLARRNQAAASGHAAGSLPPKATAGPRGTTPAARPVAGWVAGCCCPAVSVPSFSKRDGLTLHEWFTDNAVAGFVRQWSKGADIPLLFGHGGPVIARGIFNITLRSKRLTGLEFTARLFESDLSRRVLDAFGDKGLAVSVGYISNDAKQWHTERPGLGKIRVIDEARLHHIAIIPPTSGTEAAYRGARAFGIKGNRVGCPREIRDRAQNYAYRVVKEQALTLTDALRS
jgi:hypothetical protein